MGELTLTRATSLGALPSLLSVPEGDLPEPTTAFLVERGGEPVSLLVRRQHFFENLAFEVDPESSGLFVRALGKANPRFDALQEALETLGLPTIVNTGRRTVITRAALGVSDAIVPGAVPDVPGRLELLSLASVYGGPSLEENPYSYRLLESVEATLARHPGYRRVLVLGAGNGYETVHLAKTFPRLELVATEISPLALENTRLNVELHGVGAQVTPLVSDLFESVDGRFDLIVFAPPRAVSVETATRGGETQQRGVVEEHLRQLRSHPEKYDLDGELLARTLQGYSAHLEEGGTLHIMSDRELLPAFAAEHAPGAPVETTFTGPWTRKKPEEGEFAIFGLGPARR